MKSRFKTEAEDCALDGRGDPAPTVKLKRGYDTQSVAAILDCAVLGFVAEDFAGV